MDKTASFQYITFATHCKPTRSSGEIVLIPYKKEEIENVIREILLSAATLEIAYLCLLRMHQQRLPKGACWENGPVLHFNADGSRSANFTLTRTLGVDPIVILVRVEKEEIRTEYSCLSL